MSAQAIASKIRRALRNGTGASFTYEQLREIVEIGLLQTLSALEAKELCAPRALVDIEPEMRPATTAVRPKPKDKRPSLSIVELTKGL